MENCKKLFVTTIAFAAIATVALAEEPKVGSLCSPYAFWYTKPNFN